MPSRLASTHRCREGLRVVARSRELRGKTPGASASCRDSEDLAGPAVFALTKRGRRRGRGGRWRSNCAAPTVSPPCSTRCSASAHSPSASPSADIAASPPGLSDRSQEVPPSPSRWTVRFLSSRPGGPANPRSTPGAGCSILEPASPPRPTRRRAGAPCRNRASLRTAGRVSRARQPRATSTGRMISATLRPDGTGRWLRRRAWPRSRDRRGSGRAFPSERARWTSARRRLTCFCGVVQDLQDIPLRFRERRKAVMTIDGPSPRYTPRAPDRRGPLKRSRSQRR